MNAFTSQLETIARILDRKEAARLAREELKKQVRVVNSPSVFKAKSEMVVKIIMEELAKGAPVTTVVLSDLVGQPRGFVYKRLSELEEDNVVSRVGSRSKSQWVLGGSNEA